MFNYKFMYLFLILATVNIPSEFIQVFPFTFVLSVCLGITQFTNKEYFSIFIKEVKNYICLMLVSTFALMYLAETKIPEGILFQMNSLNLEQWIKVYLQLCLFYSILKISKHSYYLIYNTKQYVVYNIEKYLKEVPFASDYKKIIAKNIKDLNPSTKLQSKYKRFMMNVLNENKHNPLLRQKLYDAHIHFIYKNHVVLKTWQETDKILKCKLEKGSFKDIFLNKELIFPPALPKNV